MKKKGIREQLQGAFDYVTARPSNDCEAVNVPQEHLMAFCEYLKSQLAFDLLNDVTAIDWDKETPRFTVVYHFFSSVKHYYLRVAVDCISDDEPAVPTLVTLWAAANWHEREVYDMFGIKFEKHPDMKRILLWDDYPYFPLRKEFPLAGIESDLPGADVAQETGAKVIASPMMGGPFCSKPGDLMSESEPSGADQSWTEEAEKPGKLN